MVDVDMLEMRWASVRLFGCIIEGARLRYTRPVPKGFSYVLAYYLFPTLHDFCNS